MPKTYKLLIVDDDPDYTEMLSLVLPKDEFDVIVENSPSKAIEVASSELPDIVLLDIAMHGMDGVEVLREIKQRKIPTRVVMFSGQISSVELVVACMRNGACDVIQKGIPDVTRVLIERLRRCVVLDETLTERAANPIPIVGKLQVLVEDLLGDVKQTKVHLAASRAEVKSLTAKCRDLERLNMLTEIVAKCVYVLLAAAVVYAFVSLGATPSGYAVMGFFIVVLAILFVPFKFFRRFTASFSKLRIEIGSSRSN